MMSTNDIRPRNQQFDIKKFMIENPKTHMISQFWPYSSLTCLKFNQNQVQDDAELKDSKSKYQ